MWRGGVTLGAGEKTSPSKGFTRPTSPGQMLRSVLEECGLRVALVERELVGGECSLSKKLILMPEISFVLRRS